MLLQRKLIITGIIIVMLGIALWYFNKYGQLLLWNANEICVNTDQTLQLDKVEIRFGAPLQTLGSSNDQLFRNRGKHELIFQGKIISNITNEYGENDFLVTYNNRHYLFFRHYKFNRRYQHRYYFSLYPKNSKIFLRVTIKGRDPMEFEQPMVDIKA